MFFILKENLASGSDTAVAGDKILGTLQFIHRDFVCGSAKSPLKWSISLPGEPHRCRRAENIQPKGETKGPPQDLQNNPLSDQDSNSLHDLRSSISLRNLKRMTEVEDIILLSLQYGTVKEVSGRGIVTSVFPFPWSRFSIYGSLKVADCIRKPPEFETSCGSNTLGKFAHRCNQKLMRYSRKE